MFAQMLYAKYKINLPWYIRYFFWKNDVQKLPENNNVLCLIYYNYYNDANIIYLTAGLKLGYRLIKIFRIKKY